MSALGRAARWLVSASPVPDHVYETWQCPVCDRDVEVETVPMAWRQRGGWLPPGQHELVVLCARQHGTHRRDGSPPRELEAGDPLAHLRLVRRDDDAGDVLVLDDADPVLLRRVGEVFEAYAVAPLAASDLVGPFGHLVAHGRFLGVVPAGAVRFVGDDLLDCPTLRAWQRSQGSTSMSSPGGWTSGGSAAVPSSRPS
ncbi:MAG TPA: hypothetical protein VEA78_09145 [Acidimicrobiales bacterium]|nr:hypothetical protein [Acidimicrobiales bacterium]